MIVNKYVDNNFIFCFGRCNRIIVTLNHVLV